MKVLMLNGSPHPAGCTFTALSEIGAELTRQGVEWEIVQIGGGPERDCLGCGKCTEQGCIFDDDGVNDFIAKAREADGFVFGTPVYYGQPNGALLAIIQRALFANGKCFEFKPFANVAVCRRGGASASFSTMNMAFQMMNMPQATSQYWNIAYGAAPGETAQDSEGLQTMRTLARNMAWMLKSLCAEGSLPHPEKEAQQRTSFIR